MWCSLRCCERSSERDALPRKYQIHADTTVFSQVEDGVDGVIVPLDNAGCADGIAQLIADRAKQEQLASNIRLRDYGNEAEAKKIMELL